MKTYHHQRAAMFCLLLAALSVATAAWADVPPLRNRVSLVMGVDRQGNFHALPRSICVRQGQALRLIADAAVEIGPGDGIPPTSDQVPNKPFWRRLHLPAEKFVFKLTRSRGTYEVWSPAQSQGRDHFRRRNYEVKDLILVSVPSEIGTYGLLEVATPDQPIGRYRLVDVDRSGNTQCRWAHPDIYEGGFAP